MTEENKTTDAPVPGSPDYPLHSELTIGAYLKQQVAIDPDHEFVVYPDRDLRWTYKDFDERTDALAKGLLAIGMKPGDHLGVWARNIPDWLTFMYASAKIGVVMVTVNPVYKSHELDYVLKQSDMKALCVIDAYRDVDYLQIIRDLVPESLNVQRGFLHSEEYPFLENLIYMGPEKHRGFYSVPELLLLGQHKPDSSLEWAQGQFDNNDVVMMQYTSGTTGFPKGVMLTHYNVVNNGKAIGDCMDLSSHDHMMIQVPMFHCFGMVLSMTSCMTHGATLCPMPYFSAKVSLACINQERITCFNGVPTMFIAMFNHPDYKKTDFSYMRTGIMAGSGCPPELMRRAAQPDEMHMTDIVSVYGQTESAPGSTMSACGDPLDLRCNTVGYAFPHIECKIIDPETGEEVPDGVNGEFCSRGYNTMKGYYKMPEATAATVDKEGWLHSGDLACRDENGCYRITGRLKDMIIRGGENIYPKEIEEFIYTHPAVKDVQVIGVPDKKYGEEAMACIILKEPGSVTVEEMLDYIKASMARHKVPKYIDFVDAFPMNAAGKILKYKMREEATERFGLEGAAGIDTAQTAEQVKR